MSGGPVVVADGLWKAYGETQAVRDLSFEARPGAVMGLLGPNGAGKTTTFYMIVGLITPNEGNIMLDDDGAVWIIDFGFAELAASDANLNADVAELLLSLSPLRPPRSLTSAPSNP